MDYNWDSIDVGNPWMNTSQNFFSKLDDKKDIFSLILKYKHYIKSSGAPHILHERNTWRGAEIRGGEWLNDN